MEDNRSAVAARRTKRCASPPRTRAEQTLAAVRLSCWAEASRADVSEQQARWRPRARLEQARSGPDYVLTCPVSTGGGTRRVQLVWGGGNVSEQQARWRPRRTCTFPLRRPLRSGRLARPAATRGRAPENPSREGAEACPLSTRRVPHPALSGHAAAGIGCPRRRRERTTRAARGDRAPLVLSLSPPPSRTNWTRLVPPPVLTGHVST